MKIKKQIQFDNIHFKKIKKETVDYSVVMENVNESSGSILYSKGKISNKFFTEDSKLYITPKEQQLLDKGIKLDRNIGKWDTISSRIAMNYLSYRPATASYADILYKKFEEKTAILQQGINEASRSFASRISIVQLWNMSIVGAILIGMVSMTFIYRYLGQGAAAGVLAEASSNAPIERQLAANDQVGKVLGQEIAKEDLKAASLSKADQEKADFEKEVREMVKGYPVEEMLPYIFEKDKTVASFLISISKKESAWGKRVPVLNGQDCYNYWGYRGQRKLMGTGGHTCFNSRKDAVDTVAKRIKTLVEEKGKDTPAKMVLWKCGTNCSSDSGAKKWVSDVNLYFEKLND